MLDKHEVPKRGFDAISAEVISEWERFIPDKEPVRSNDLNDYIGHVYTDMDNDDD